ncbi:unnamed protein product [Vitrella brassicaformis CCMP3155]|uniref:Uncharacterized protein n=1 Tax=Vitrella brassicaformis (strain CCMP3155) TaxID=1169540 RepID=A0A0G4H7Q3_VITBC|nr:unnamed protein product [Vitrella brassicaformis CCMP3155]|eukprot:CEM39794.1 unnamed protein product [Vitrella brassicaformis CCMP3155]
MWLPAVLLTLPHAVGAARRSPAAAAPGSVSFVAPSIMLRGKTTAVAEGKQLQRGQAPRGIGVRTRQPTVLHFSGWGEPTAVTSLMRFSLELLVIFIAGGAILGIILMFLHSLVWVAVSTQEAMWRHQKNAEMARQEAEKARQRREEERAKEQERMRRQAAKDPKMEWDDRMRERQQGKNTGGVFGFLKL